MAQTTPHLFENLDCQSIARRFPGVELAAIERLLTDPDGLTHYIAKTNDLTPLEVDQMVSDMSDLHTTTETAQLQAA